MTEVINLKKEWYIGDKIGEGGFGRVYLAQSESGEEVVAKFVPNVPGADRELLFEEFEGVSNIVPVLDKGHWKDSLVLVMPRADESLRDFLEGQGGRLSVDVAVQVLVDVAQALVEMDGRVVHRDIKPDNILLLNGVWCIADFGISRYVEASTSPDTRKFSLTPPYAAPEQWHGKTATNLTDVYAVGVVAYELLAGRRPFSGPDRHNFRRQHLEDSPESIPGVPPRLQSLIDSCLSKSSEARPRPKSLLARLKESLRMKDYSEAAKSLQQANVLAVQRRVELDRQVSLAHAEFERRVGLGNEATRSLEKLIAVLNKEIMSNAPATVPAKPAGINATWKWSLIEANLGVAPASSLAKAWIESDGYSPPFDIVAHSVIALRVPRKSCGYEGRSHSLWYCDAKDIGVFRWFETAFMHSPLIRHKSEPIDPFALKPGQKAYKALSQAIDVVQVAWPFTPIDQGNEFDFLERWIDWFAKGARGLLERPSRMPERDVSGSWRRGA